MINFTCLFTASCFPTPTPECNANNVKPTFIRNSEIGHSGTGHTSQNLSVPPAHTSLDSVPKDPSHVPCCHSILQAMPLVPAPNPSELLLLSTKNRWMTCLPMELPSPCILIPGTLPMDTASQLLTALLLGPAPSSSGFPPLQHKPHQLEQTSAAQVQATPVRNKQRHPAASKVKLATRGPTWRLSNRSEVIQSPKIQVTKIRKPKQKQKSRNKTPIQQ